MRSFRTGQILFACLLLLWASGACLCAQTGGTAQSSEFQSLAQAASAARDAGNAEEASNDYTRALALKPEWAEGWWELGTMQYEANHYADAVASLEKLVAIAPNMAPGWSMLGLSQFETKDYDAALASLEKAQKIGGDDPDIARVSAFHLALLLIRNGEFEQAMQLLHSSVGETTSMQVRTALGLALLRVPLLPSEVDPSREALVQAVADAWSSASPDAMSRLLEQYPKTPWLHYANGRRLEEAGQFDDAMREQKIESGISPQSALPWIEMSGLALKLKRNEDALNDAKSAVELEPELAAAHMALAKALSVEGRAQRAAMETSAAARLAKRPINRDTRMIAMYTSKATDSRPDDSAAWSAAMQDFSGGRYQETVSALKGWLTQNPNDGTAWAVTGLSEYALKDYANARIHLQRGLDLGIKGGAGSIELANERLAQLMIREGQFDAATTLLTPLAGHPPVSADMKLTMGLALLRIPVLPDDLDAKQRDLAQTAGGIVQLLLASRYAEAFPEFQKLITDNPTTPWLHYAYGGALDSLSQYDDAKMQMHEELKLSTHSALPWIRLASIAAQQHVPAEALNAAQKAVGLAPDSAEARYELGRAWLESGDAQKAIDELVRANSIRPDNPEIHFALARAYTKAGLTDKATAEREEFMRLKETTTEKATNDGASGSIQTNK